MAWRRFERLPRVERFSFHLPLSRAMGANPVRLVACEASSSPSTGAWFHCIVVQLNIGKGFWRVRMGARAKPKLFFLQKKQKYLGGLFTKSLPESFKNFLTLKRTTIFFNLIF